MKKLFSKIFYLILAFFILNPACFAWSFKKEKAVLIMSPTDPTISTNYDEQMYHYDVFKPNSKIYFYIYNPKGFKSNFIKYQIVKQDDKAHVGGYSRIRNITKRLKNKNEYSDYFTLSEKGKYYLQVFDITNLHQWVAITSFGVVDD